MLNRLSVGCSHTGTIHSEPAGAEIFVDGESKGHSPVTFEEKSSGGGTVQVKAKLNGQEVTKAVERSEISWASVGGVGGGSSAAACAAVNATGCGAFLVLGVFALPINALGFCLLPIGPAIADFAGGKVMPDNVTIDMRTAAKKSDDEDTLRAALAPEPFPAQGSATTPGASATTSKEASPAVAY